MNKNKKHEHTTSVRLDKCIHRMLKAEAQSRRHTVKRLIEDALVAVYGNPRLKRGVE
jgi:predicted HicB family RNase H-like nuclease